ncbi:MAG: type II secretion system protein GspD, partial [Phycisphaerales bacterium]
RVGYLNSTTTNTSTTQSVEFLDVGTQLLVRPFVGKNGLIRLELRPQVSNFTLRQAADGAGNIVTIPDEDTTEMNTNVMVRDGQTVVLGGLFTESTTTTRRQVPVLGDIPLIGSAFKGFDDETRRSEIIFLITPTLINDTVLTETGDMGNQYVEHARYGARKGLLPWSRERRVGQLLISARQLADAGKKDEALDKVDRALRLMPMSPDARELRTEITGEYRTVPNRSLIHGMMNENVQSSAGTESFNTANQVDPFQTPGFAEQIPSTVATESTDPEYIEFDPSSDADFEPDPAFEVEPVAEVETESVSDASFDLNTPAAESFFTEKVESPEFTEYTEVAAEDMGSDELLTESIASEAGSSFDQMKSVVTGEQTQVDLAITQGTTPPALDPASSTDTQTESPVFSIAAEKFGGQLIIPMPHGGSLHLNWPLNFDYIASEPTTEQPASEATFTEVPVGDDDFSDFSK